MDDRIDIPQSAWERLLADKRRLAAVVGGVVLAAALVAGLVYARAVSIDDAPSGGGIEDGTGQHEGPGSSAESSGSAEETGGAEPGTTGGPSGPGAVSDSGASGGSPGGSDAGQDATDAVVNREPYIAYRTGGAVYVAREDGTQPVKVTGMLEGVYALSPDAKTLAYVDTAAGRLVLADVASGTTKDVGQALDDTLSWTPDSTTIAYTAGSTHAPEVRTVKRDGSGGVRVGVGHSPRISPDGTGIAWIADAAFQQAGPAVVAPLGAAGSPSASPDLVATEIAFAADGVVATVYDTAEGAWRLVTEQVTSAWRFEAGARWRALAVKSAADKPTTLAHFCASPDGAYLAYAEAGDDGYSRTSVLDLVKGTATTLSVRRDTYPLCWSADGSRVFFVEGNAFQGEATSLMSATPNGFGRAVVVGGAGL